MESVQKVRQKNIVRKNVVGHLTKNGTIKMSSLDFA
jgi:hypothetical protein